MILKQRRIDRSVSSRSSNQVPYAPAAHVDALQQRVDLICRDLVSAYHRLATKVAEAQPSACEE